MIIILISHFPSESGPAPQLWISFHLPSAWQSFTYNHFHYPHFFKAVRIRAFSIMNMLIPSYSRATTISRTLTTCCILLHFDSSWFPKFCSNLVQLPQLWISSSSLGMSLPHPTATRQRAVGAIFCLKKKKKIVPSLPFILFILYAVGIYWQVSSLQVASIFPNSDALRYELLAGTY